LRYERDFDKIARLRHDRRCEQGLLFWIFSMHAVLRIAIVLLCYVTLAIRPGMAQEEVPERAKADATQRIKLLIERLASPNVAPEIRDEGNEGWVKFSPSYDRDKQVDVYLAAQQLLGEGELALDLLLAHPKDDRYSFTWHSPSDRNYPVSIACELIADRIIQSYEGEMNRISRSQFVFNPPLHSKITLAQWWQENKKRGLVTIQLEALDQQIKVMEKLDAATASAWHPEAEQHPRDEFNRLRDENLRTLKSIRIFVAMSGKPHRAKSLDHEHGVFFGLPWSRRYFNK
jgi:hypothetical protein